MGNIYKSLSALQNVANTSRSADRDMLAAHINEL